MIGVAVMSIVFLALPAAFVSVRKLNFETASVFKASELASSRIEYLRTQEFSTIEAMIGNPVNEAVDHDTRKNISYGVETTVVSGADELDDMLDVTVKVQWIENQRLREIVGRAFFTENGMSDKQYAAGN